MFNFFKRKVEEETLEEQRADLLKFPEQYRQQFLDLVGPECDEVSGATGEFGKTITNPIPVNGPIGEIKYLNRLNTKSGSSLIYHRLGCIDDKTTNPIDVFETVSMDGTNWGIFYIDMYHPRRSTKVPIGYEFGPFHPVYSKWPVGFGSLERDINFPYNLGTYIEKRCDLFGDGTFGKRLARRYEEFIVDKEKFKRPADQIAKVKEILPTLAPTAYYQLDVSPV